MKIYFFADTAASDTQGDTSQTDDETGDCGLPRHHADDDDFQYHHTDDILCRNWCRLFFNTGRN